MDVGEALGDLAEHQLDLYAGQVGAKAEVRAATAEPNMVVGGAFDVEVPRIIERSGVAIRSDVPQHDLVAGLHLHAVEFVVLRALAAEVQHRGRPPDDLVDHGLLVPGGVALVLLPLVGEVEESHHPAGDRVASGLVARHRQEEEEHVELVLAELFAVDVGGEQRGDDVVGRLIATLHLQATAVGKELGRSAGGFVGVSRKVGIVATDHAVGPVEDLAAVLDRNTDHLGDRLQRQLRREILDELSVALFAHLVDDRVGAVLEVVLQQADHPRGEPSRHDAAEASVLRSVEFDHQALVHGLRHGVVEVRLVHLGAAGVRREEIGLTVDLFQVGLTGDGPVARPLIALVDPVHAWVGLAQLGEQLVVFLTLECVVIPQVDVDGHEGLRGDGFLGREARRGTRPRQIATNRAGRAADRLRPTG